MVQHVLQELSRIKCSLKIVRKRCYLTLTWYVGDHVFCARQSLFFSLTILDFEWGPVGQKGSNRGLLVYIACLLFNFFGFSAGSGKKRRVLDVLPTVY